MIPPDDVAISDETLHELVSASDGPLKREAVRSLVLSTRPNRFQYLIPVAGDEGLPDQLRADALMGMAGDAGFLEPLARQPGVVGDAARTGLRVRDGRPIQSHQPSAEDIDSWMTRVGVGGDSESGWRVFSGPEAPAAPIVTGFRDGVPAAAPT